MKFGFVFVRREKKEKKEGTCNGRASIGTVNVDTNRPLNK
jgi:hypothetical protein